jgi:tetratricopeptide (TPR) repeat protein
MTEVEAVDCFASYAGVADNEIDNVRSSILEIVERLGLVPLAVSMSGIYFKNTEGQLDELALRYFSDLEALADSDSRPPGFPRTAFAAIQHAVRNIGKGTPAGDTYGRSARAVLEIGSLLAPELLPLNFMLLATAEEIQVNLAKLPVPTEVDKVTRRGVLSTLRTQTIARRVVNDGEGNRTAVSDTVAIHPLVHDILQRSYLAAVPSGYLESQCTVFMYFLIGWLGQMRTQGEYFAVEQLRLHANALLALVDDNEPMSSLSAQNARVHTYAKTLLQAELSTCAASRGRLQAALELGRSAIQTLSPYMHEPYARRIAMKILANMVADLSMGEAAPEAVRTCAIPFVSSVAEAESDTNAAVRALAYTLASDTLGVINRLDVYRDSPGLSAIRQRLLEVTQRDPSLHTQDATRMAKANELYEAGRFSELLDLTTQLLAANTSLEGAVILNAIKIVAQLHTDAVDEALAGVDQLLELRNYADYVLLSLHEALKKVGRELHRVIDLEGFSSVRPRLQSALDRVTQRYYELSDAAGPDSVDQS